MVYCKPTGLSPRECECVCGASRVKCEWHMSDMPVVMVWFVIKVPRVDRRDDCNI